MERDDADYAERVIRRWKRENRYEPYWDESDYESPLYSQDTRRRTPLQQRSYRLPRRAEWEATQ